MLEKVIVGLARVLNSMADEARFQGLVFNYRVVICETCGQALSSVELDVFCWPALDAAQAIFGTSRRFPV